MIPKTQNNRNEIVNIHTDIADFSTLTFIIASNKIVLSEYRHK